MRRAGGAAGDGRRRAGVQRDDQSVDRHRRRHRARVAGRRARRRSRVRAVSSDGAGGRRRAAVSAVRGAARRRRVARQRRRRALHGALRARPASWRRAISSRARSCAKRRARAAPVYLSLQHLDPDWVHAAFPTIAAACRIGGPRSRARSHSGRAGRALHDGRRRNRRLGRARRCPGSTRPARWRAPASTAPTVSRATRCSKGWSSARARRRRCCSRRSAGGDVQRASDRVRRCRKLTAAVARLARRVHGTDSVR